MAWCQQKLQRSPNALAAGVFLLVVWDMALWRIIFSAPSLPAPGPLASTGS